MDTLASKILSGNSLSVILKPDPKAQTDFPEMVESFDLQHIVISGDNVLGKTSNTHAINPRFSKYDRTFGTAYAYNNYADIVLNSSHTEGICRFSHTGRYSDIRFETREDYEIIWNSHENDDVAAVEKAILAGCKLKIGLLDNKGIWNIHPVHMPSFYTNRNFLELFTDQDAMPLIMRKPAEVMELEKDLKINFKKAVRETSGQVNRIWQIMPYLNDPTFFSTFYTVRSDGTFLRGAIVAVEEEPETYKELRIYASKIGKY
ncbi:MAG: hypothetical protein WD407_00550 [Rhodospirillales bacterium]